MSELTSNRIRATAAKLGLPHLAEALNQYTQSVTIADSATGCVRPVRHAQVYGGSHFSCS
ncbi:hypothetical protein ACFV3E_46475 [Streptomyces sp. NPDC059718]